jgi:hypothetical protein
VAHPILLQDDFTGGMRPDLPHDKLPKNAVRNMVDFIPNANDAPLAMRNGWSRVGATMSTTYAGAVAFAPFAAGAQLVGIADTGAVFQVPHTSLSANTTRGTAQVPIQPPIFYRNVLYIPSDNGSTTVKSYGGTSNAAAASGSPPTGMLCCAFKDHLVLARDATTPRRIWFSNGGDAGTWDTAADGQWLDATHPVTGLVVVRNMILAFAEEGVERIRGDIIPGIVNSDMVREPLPIPGCADPASIAVADDVCYYANASGIYMTDGIGSVDLTDQCDIKQWWGQKLGSYDGSWTLAGGFFQGKYIVSGYNGSSFAVCLVVDVKRRAAYEFTNVPAIMFAAAPTGHAASYPGGLYMAERTAPWLARFSAAFDKASVIDGSGSVREDGNSTFRSPRLRTGYFRGVPGKKRIKKVYVHFDLASGFNVTAKTYNYEDTASANATFSLLGNDLGGGLFQKLSVKRGDREGIAIEVIGTSLDAPTSSFNIRKFEAEILPQETSRR